MIKKEIRGLVFTCIVIFTANTIDAQNYKDHKWYKARPHTLIPDSLSGEDAVMIHNNQFVYNDIVDLASARFSSKRTVMQKIKILTQKGLEEYSKVFVNIYPNEFIKVVDARTIKPSGKTVNLKSKDIKQLNFKSRFYQDSRFQQLRFSIPGVEIGDEIEIIYTVNSGKLRTAGDIIMNTYLPCLSASVTYGSSKSFVHEFKMYNGMSKFVNQSSQTNTTLVWRMSNLRSIGNQYRAIYTNDIPYIRYVIRRFNDGNRSIDLSINNWDNLYKKYKDYYTDLSIIKDSKYIEKFIQNFKNQDPKAGNAKILKDIHQYIYDNVEVGILDNAHKNKLSKYYLENKIIDNYNLYMLYEQLFKHLDIKRYICFGRNKYDGLLDRNFVAPHIIQHDFYAFKEGAHLRFIYPSLSYKKYLLNELPRSLRGTNIMMIADGEKGSIFNESMEIRVPMNSPENNYKLKKIKIEVNSPLDSVFTSKSSTVFSGVFSTMYRQNHKEKVGKKEYDFYANFISENEMSIDSLDLIDEKKNFPYPYKLESEQNFPLHFSKIDDKLFNLDVKDLFSISSLYVSDEKRFLNYHTSYLYSDLSIVQIEFAQKIKIENLQNINDLTSENIFGSIGINISQQSENSLVISLSYKIKKELLEPKDYQLLTDLNKSLEDLLGQKITISFE